MSALYLRSSNFIEGTIVINIIDLFYIFVSDLRQVLLDCLNSRYDSAIGFLLITKRLYSRRQVKRLVIFMILVVLKSLGTRARVQLKIT